MNILHRLVLQITIGIILVGMASVTMAGPLSRGIPVVGSKGEGFNTEKQSIKKTFNHSNVSTSQGCLNRSSQGTDFSIMDSISPYGADCDSMLDGETAWIYAPGCANLESSNNRMQSGHCSADDQLVTNLGNLVVHSSDRVLGRVDVSVHSSESNKLLSSVVPIGEQDTNAWNQLSPSIPMNQALIATAFRFDRLGEELFDGEEDPGLSLDPNFDHQLVMSGKLAFLVPKDGLNTRGLELGDLVFLLLFSILPEKKRIKRFFRRTRQFQIFS